MKAGAVIVVGCLLSVACARSEALESSVKAGQHPALCKAPGAPEKVEQAFCNGDRHEIRQAMFSGSDRSSDPTHRQFMAILLRIWNRDHSYGQELPWNVLESPFVRALIAQELSAAIRNGDISSSLKPFQEFGAAYYQSARTEEDRLEALRLLGAADASMQIPVIAGVIKASGSTANEKSAALLALGSICSERAKLELEKIAAAKGQVSEDANRALALRAGIAEPWCRARTK